MDVKAIIFVALSIFVSMTRAAGPPAIGETQSECEEQNDADREATDLLYIGCYHRDCFKNNTYSNISNINECTGGCKNGSFEFAALELGDSCYCGSFICKDQSQRYCDDRCGIPCRFGDGKFICGGKGYIQVYSKGKLKGMPTIDSGKGEAGLTMWLVPAIVIGAFFTLGGLLTWIGIGIKRRWKRRQNTPAQQTETNQSYAMSRPRHVRRQQLSDNLYSTSDYHQANHVHTATNNRSIPPDVTLSSSHAYDHTGSKDRIRGNAENLKTPLRVSNPVSSTENRNEKMQVYGRDEGVKGDFCCSDSNGIERSCRNNVDNVGDVTGESSNYFTLEPNKTKKERKVCSKKPIPTPKAKPKARRGKLHNKATCSESGMESDECSEYSYATCSEFSLLSDFHPNTTIQEENEYETIPDSAKCPKSPKK